MVQNKKLIVFDVDGVIFKSLFILRLSRSIGFFPYLRVIFLCFLFDIGKISIERLLGETYKIFKGVPLEKVWLVYKKMVLIRNAQNAVSDIRSRGHEVTLISSGVPDFLIHDLSKKLNANYGFGIEVGVNNNHLTGDVRGALSHPTGKITLLEGLLSKLNLSWSSVIVAADDRNNLEIMEKAGVGIGINANYPVRRKAKYLIDSGDLGEILNFIDIEDEPTYTTIVSILRQDKALSWKHEITRKLVHVSSAIIPLGIAVTPLPVGHVVFVILVGTLVYTVSEIMRLNGIAFPVISNITEASIRGSEKRRFLYAPVALMLGAAISLLIFPLAIASAVILIVAFADTAATLIGKAFGRHKIPYNVNKSIEGSCGALIVGVLCACIFLPFIPALAAGITACLIESLPLNNIVDDNLSVPLGTGLILQL
ncbi:MAG: haloacid dehalogenase-like hydrolase [Candidatus Brocadiales bacterium]